MTTMPNALQTTEMPKMAAFNARDLIQDGSQVCIVLDDQQYFLRITRAGKLILTK